MTSAALGRVFRDASGRIVAALASRFRDLDLAEDSFAEACARALKAWSREGPPRASLVSVGPKMCVSFSVKICRLD